MGKVTEGMGGTGQDMGWGGGRQRERRKGREDRGYSPQTTIPGAATADLDPHFVNSGSAPAECSSWAGLEGTEPAPAPFQAQGQWIGRPPPDT